MATTPGPPRTKRSRAGRWFLLIGIVLAVPSWSLWLRVSATTHKVWVTQSILYAIPYVVMLVCIARNILTPVAFGIATAFCWYGLGAAFFFAAIGVLGLEKTFIAMAVVIPAHLLMTVGLLLCMQRPAGKEIAEWFIGIAIAVAYALSFLALLGRDTGRQPFPPTHGFSAPCGDYFMVKMHENTKTEYSPWAEKTRVEGSRNASLLGYRTHKGSSGSCA